MNEITKSDDRRVSVGSDIREQMLKMGDELKKALPAHISVDKFQRVALTAINLDPEVLQAERKSLIGALMRAAQDGLLPDKREGALVIFNSKNRDTQKWEKQVQWMPMIAGVLKKMRQSGEIASITANVVYENDEFVLRLGDEESIQHTPPPFGTERGKTIGVYAIATLKGGEKIREVMDHAEIEKVRGVSKSAKSGPWFDWWEEMAKKTVIRRLSKRLPMSSDLESVINDESTDADFAQSAVAALNAPAPLTREMIEGQAADTPALTDSTVSNDDQTASQIKYSEIIERASLAADLQALAVVDEEFQKHAAAFSDENHALIEEALSNARKRIDRAEKEGKTI